MMVPAGFEPCTHDETPNSTGNHWPPMQLTAMIRKEGDIYVAWTPELDVASQGPSAEEALENLREAVDLYLEDEDANEPSSPTWMTTFEVGHGQAADPVG